MKEQIIINWIWTLDQKQKYYWTIKIIYDKKFYTI